MAREALPRGVIQIGERFWNIRGSYKVGGVLEIGTHASLIERANGKFVLLDACAMSESILGWFDACTQGGAKLEAILHLHPFHTVHVRSVYERYPEARLYGTERHRLLAPELPWQPVNTNDRELADIFGDDLDFSVPEGVELVPDDPKLHFGSVLAFHGASRTLHVDDTLLCFALPWPIRMVKRHLIRLHPTLGKVLIRRAGAAAEFRRWGESLVERARELNNLCAAHSSVLLESQLEGSSIAARIQAALAAAEGTLRTHQRKYG
jgi:hypothetical protein